MTARRKLWLFIAAALGVSVGLAALVAPFAASSPDGLERAAHDLGISGESELAASGLAPMPDYAVPGVANEKASTALAGVIGVLLAFGIALAIGALIRRRRSGHHPSGHKTVSDDAAGRVITKSIVSRSSLRSPPCPD